MPNSVIRFFNRTAHRLKECSSCSCGLLHCTGSVGIFPGPVTEVLKLSVCTVGSSFAVQGGGRRTFLFQCLIQAVGEVCGLLKLRFRFMLRLLVYTANSGNNLYRAYFENTRNSVCCCSPSLDAYFNSAGIALLIYISYISTKKFIDLNRFIKFIKVFNGIIENHNLSYVSR